MSETQTAVVYRFSRLERGRPISPRRMWATLEAIAELEGCTPMLETARKVDPDLLEAGFYFDRALKTHEGPEDH